jgi:hypothetical protein
MTWTTEEIKHATRTPTPDLHREINARIDAARRPGLDALDRACQYVLDLGYRPDECRIEYHSRPDVERRRLTVLERPCFEVTWETHLNATHTLEITMTPLVIEWPAAR